MNAQMTALWIMKLSKVQAVHDFAFYPFRWSFLFTAALRRYVTLARG